jgi:hypothetical protein
MEKEKERKNDFMGVTSRLGLQRYGNHAKSGNANAID